MFINSCFILALILQLKGRLVRCFFAFQNYHCSADTVIITAGCRRSELLRVLLHVDVFHELQKAQHMLVGLLATQNLAMQDSRGFASRRCFKEVGKFANYKKVQYFQGSSRFA